MSKFVLLPVVLSLWLLAAAGELTIFNTTDIHGRLQRTARLKSLFDRVNADQRVIIDCGDAIQGTLESRLNYGVAMVELFNALGYDVWVPGNHDYEFGKQPLLQLFKRFKGSVLGNFYYPEYRAQSYVLLERAKLKIAVIGLTEYRAAERMIGDDEVKTLEYQQVLKKTMPQLIAGRPDLIVLAIHAGEYSFPGGIAGLLKSYPEIDLVLCGHSHEAVFGKTVSGAWLVQAGKHLENVAQITVVFNDQSKKIESIRSQLIEVDSLPAADPALEQIIRQYAAGNPYPDKPPARRLALGEIAPNMLHQISGADVAYFCCPADNFSRTAPASYTEFFQLLPFENYLCNIELTQNEFDQFIAEQRAGNQKRNLAWAVSPDKPPAKAKLLLSTNNYILCNSPVLKEVIKNAPDKLHFLNKIERDVIFEGMP